MRHLLPIKWVLAFCFGAGALAVFAALFVGWSPEDQWFVSTQKVIRWSTAAAIVVPMLFYAMWRFVPEVQELIFPYLGGHWSGQLKFEGERGEGTRAVKLVVNHTPLSLQLVLNSEESFSKTLAVHADRDLAAMRKRLYYVYLNERKEGFPGAGETYRGLAIMRVEIEPCLTLHGNYFTERGQAGMLTLSRDNFHPIWAFWK
jgi:hypothetical protein